MSNNRIYFPPLLFAALFGTLAAGVIARSLNYLGLARYVWHPPLLFVALAVICTGLIGIFIIPI
ncbi:MAG: DUF1656 domain-containing protein [Planctomycetota bacterium]